MPNQSRKRQLASPDVDEEPIGPSKKVKQGKATGAATASSAAPGEAARDDDGNEYWEISGMRRVVVSDFKGKTFVNIREYYEKDGKALPGKKGISLPVDQYSKLVALLPQIAAALEAKGEEVPRPLYDAQPSSKPAAGNDEGEVERETKQNFEETSEDEE